MSEKNLDAAYRLMAQEEAREAEALEWAEAAVGDVADETRCGNFQPGSGHRVE